jgi:hypothetical protein
MSKAVDSFETRFNNSFKEYWNEYGRMGSALMNMDWDKMAPDEDSMINQYYKDQMDAKKNFVFVSPEDEDGIFNKKFASEFISNAGFALGTFAGVGVELAADAAITVLTGGGGAGTFGATIARLLGKEAVKEGTELAVRQTAKSVFGEGAKEFFSGVKAIDKSADELRGMKAVAESTTTNAAKQIDQIAKAAELGKPSAEGTELFNHIFDGVGQATEELVKTPGFMETTAGKVLKKMPFVGGVAQTAEKIGLGYKAGFSGTKIAGMVIGGTKRLASEINMSASEAAFEAVSSYGDTLSGMLETYRQEHNGEPPSALELSSMRADALKASSANFNTNMVILGATNAIQFGNMFNKFHSNFKFLRDFGGEATEDFLTVEGKLATTGEKALQRYRKGFTGTFGVLGDVARDFGKKEALYQFGRSVAKNVIKFEVVEGAQENLQEVSASAWKNYYIAKHNHVQTTIMDAVGRGFNEQLSSQGLKTFLSGALTGMIVSGPTKFAMRSVTGLQNLASGQEYKNYIKNVDADLAKTNDFLRQIAGGKTFAEKIVNFANQIDATNQQDEAANKNKEYHFNNGKDNALLSAIITAKRTNSVEALAQAVRNMGSNMTADEFKEAFKIDLADTKYSTPREFANSIADNVEKYSEVYDGVRRKIGTMINPMNYAMGSRDQMIASHMRYMQEEAVHIIAMDAIKGQMTAKRLDQLGNDIMSSPALANSAHFAINSVSNLDGLTAAQGTLQTEIKALESQINTPGLTDDIKSDLLKQLASKKEIMKSTEKWNSYWHRVHTKKTVAEKDEKGNEITKEVEVPTGDVIFKGTQKVGKTDVVEPSDEHLYNDEVLKTFMAIVNAKNKEAGLTTEITPEEAQEALSKVIDYIRLDDDAKGYMKSIQVLTSPEKVMQLIGNMSDGNLKYNLVVYLNNTLTNMRISINRFYKELGIDIGEHYKADRIKIMDDLLTLVQDSEEYKKLLALASDPNTGLKDASIIDEYTHALENKLQDKQREIALKYKDEDLVNDISTEDYEKAAKGELTDVARDMMARVLIKFPDQLSERQTALLQIPEIKEQVDARVVELKAQEEENKKQKIKDDIEKERQAKLAANQPTTTPQQSPTPTAASATRATTPVSTSEKLIPGVTRYDVLDLQALIESETGFHVFTRRFTPELRSELKTKYPQLYKQLYDLHLDTVNQMINAIDDRREIKKQLLAGTPLQRAKSANTLIEIFDSLPEVEKVYNKLSSRFHEVANKYPEANQQPTMLPGGTQNVQVEPALVGTPTGETMGKEGEAMSRYQHNLVPGEETTGPVGTGAAAEKDNQALEILQFHAQQQQDGKPQVVDNQGNVIVTAETPKEAGDKADSLNSTFDNVSFAIELFKSENAKAIATPELITSFVDSAIATMNVVNMSEGTNFKNLKEFSETPKGKKILSKIAINLLGMNNAQASNASIETIANPEVITPSVDPITIIENNGGVTEEDLDSLFAELKGDIEAVKSAEKSEKSSNFVIEEEPITEQGIVEELKKLASCFKP